LYDDIIIPALENYKKSNGHSIEEFYVLGKQLNEIYINTIEHVQKAQCKFSVYNNNK
jgi:hypothetical protein